MVPEVGFVPLVLRDGEGMGQGTWVLLEGPPSGLPVGSQGLPSEGMGAVGGCGAIWSCVSLFLGAVPQEDIPWDLLSHGQPVSGPVLAFFLIFFFFVKGPRLASGS